MKRLHLPSLLLGLASGLLILFIGNGVISLWASSSTTQLPTQRGTWNRGDRPQRSSTGALSNPTRSGAIVPAGTGALSTGSALPLPLP